MGSVPSLRSPRLVRPRLLNPSLKRRVFPPNSLGQFSLTFDALGLSPLSGGLTVGIDSPVRPQKVPLLMSCAPLTVPSLKSEAFAQSKPTTTVLRPTSKMFGSLLEPHFARCSSASPWLML